MDSNFVLRRDENIPLQLYPEHSHPVYEIFYLKSGQCHHLTEDKVYPLTSGDVAIFPPGIVHRCIYSTPTHSRSLFYCTADYIPSLVLPFFDHAILYSPSADDAPQIDAIFATLKEASDNPDPFADDIIRCCVTMLFLLIAKASARAESPSFPTPFVEQAVTYIQENYMNRISLTDAAAHSMISPEHLSRVFKKETGMGFNEYLNQYRLKKAETLLKSGQVKRVSEVALLCGFSESNYFSHVYKKMFGVSPSHIRKHSQKRPE